MSIPNGQAIPSERTIEILSNHHMLVDLNDPKAWFFVPTQREEVVRGYDASLQNSKLIVFQYKRVYQNRASLRIKIDRNQHNTLTSRFKRIGNIEYVFYGFSTYKNYQKIGLHYSSAPPVIFLDKMIFFDAHKIPRECKSVNYSSSNGVRPSLSPRRYGTPLPHIAGSKLISLIKKCSVGLKDKPLLNFLENEENYLNKRKGRLKSPFSMLIWYR